MQKNYTTLKKALINGENFPTPFFPPVFFVGRVAAGNPGERRFREVVNLRNKIISNMALRLTILALAVSIISLHV